MDTLEIIAGRNSADVITADSVSELTLAMRGVVANGIDTEYCDLQWLRYYGPMERLQVESDPLFQKLLERLPPTPTAVDDDESTRPNVMSGKQHSLQRMASIGGVGGGFYRVAGLARNRYILSPARDQPEPHPGLNLGYAVSFSGEVMVDAMTDFGLHPEIIDYRDEPDFPAFRERTIAQFFIDQTRLT